MLKALLYCLDDDYYYDMIGDLKLHAIPMGAYRVATHCRTIPLVREAGQPIVISNGIAEKQQNYLLDYEASTDAIKP